MSSGDSRPVDPLAILEGDDPSSAGAASLWTRWLATELLDDEHARLDHAGGSSEAGVALARVFVDVAASPHGSGGDEPEGDDASAGKVPSSDVPPEPGLLAELLAFRPKPRKAERSEGLMDPDDLGAGGQAQFPRTPRRRGTSSRCLVIGGPGQGKSTLTQYLCQLHRADLVRARVSSLAARQQQAIEVISDRAKQDRLPVPATPCLPLRIILRDFAAWMFREKIAADRALVSFVASRMTRVLNPKLPVGAAAVEAVLAKIPWLLVLDGLDEVPVTAGRAEVLAAVRALLESDVARAPHLVIATTRPQGYGGELGDFTTRHLLGLSRVRALTYANRLVDARYPGQSVRQAEILERVALAWNESTSRRLLRTPLQVSVMATLVAQIGRAPTDRWRLFSDYYRVMYQREVERPNLAHAELLRSLRRQIDEIHRLAGLWLQVRSERAGETDALLSQDELGQIIGPILERSGYEDDEERGVLVARILEAAIERLVFLVHAEDGQYGFEIRSLQELMAAEALLSGGDVEVIQRLRHIAPLDAWRNVFLFAAGKCFAETWHLAPAIVDDICPWLNDGIDDPAVKSTLTGSAIALDLIEDGAARNQPKLARSLAKLAVRLLELPPSEVHGRLAEIGAFEFETALRKAIEARLMLPEAPQRLSAWAVLATLADRSVRLADGSLEWAPVVAAATWPADGQSRRDIVTALNAAGAAAGQWLQTRMAEALGDFPPSFARDIALNASEGMPLAWLAAARPGEHDRFVAELALESEGVPTGLSLRFHPLGTSAWSLRALPALPDPSPAWLPLVLAARFGTEPSTSNFAKGIRACAATFDGAAFKELRGSLPWPLRQALVEARDPDALRALASRVDAGEMGDVPEWIAAEATWTSGLSFERLLSIESAWPTKNRHDGAFPIAAADASVSSDIRLNSSLLERAVAAYRVSPASRRALLASLVDKLVFAHCFGPRAPGIIEAAELRRVWEDVGRPPSLNGVVALLPETGDIGEWVVLLDQIGRTTPLQYYFSSAESILSVATQYYSRSPGSVGLLRILAIRLGGFWTTPSVPSELLTIDPGAFPVGSAARFYAALIRLRADATADDDDADTLPSWLPALADSIPTDPEEADIATDYLGRFVDDVPPVLSAPILAQLLERLPSHAWRLACTVLDSLHDHRKDRTSSLDDPAVWNRLGLPTPHPGTRPPSIPAPAAGIFRIHSTSFSNFRPFDKLEIEPSAAAPERGQWLILIGENGVGKSTFLRGLAFALADGTAAAGALGKSPAPYRGAREAPAKIEIRTPERSFLATIALDTEAKREALTREPRNGGHRPFLVAYGCQRGSALGGPNRDVAFTPELDIITLFDETRGLAHAETWLMKLEIAAQQDSTGRGRALLDAVIGLLRELLHVEEIHVGGDAVWVKSAATNHARMAALSDGYLTTAGWVVDMLARWIDRAKRLEIDVAPHFNKTMEGVVLIDELDLHLHPRWQVRVIDDLRELFPRMTFVVTTHNPLTLLGAKPGEVMVLRRSEVETAKDGAGAPDSPRSKSRIDVFQEDIPPGFTVDQVLTGAWFGLASTLDKGTLQLLEQHRCLLREGVLRDDARRVALEAELRRRLGGFADTSLERIAQSVAAQVLPTTARDLGPDQREELRRRIRDAVAAKARTLDPEKGTGGEGGSPR